MKGDFALLSLAAVSMAAIPAAVLLYSGQPLLDVSRIGGKIGPLQGWVPELLRKGPLGGGLMEGIGEGGGSLGFQGLQGMAPSPTWWKRTAAGISLPRATKAPSLSPTAS